MSQPRTTEQEASWQTVRRAVLKRDGHRCRDCPESVDRRDLDVHHLIPRVDGGRDEISNCITLCDGCHAARHPRLQVALSQRMMERWALRLAQWLDRSRELPSQTSALQAGLRLFGADRFRDGQLDAVLGALRGESQLVILPTGGGKSLCFQLPAVLKGQPTTVVLSPLIALMEDQVAALQRLKIPATFINSTISPEEKERRYRLLESGALSFLYVTPERFYRARPQEIARIVRLRPTFLVVDEAHVIERWGEDFRTDYSRIADIRRQLGDPPVLAFTATAGPRTQQHIKDSLGVPDARTLVSGVDRPNIALVRMQESSIAKRARIVTDLIENIQDGRAMVFVPTVKVGQQVQAALRDAGCDLPLYPLAAALGERDQLLGRFTGRLDPPLKAVICTNAFGMGLDISDVRAVINWQHPASVEDFMQEFGRAGRDGQPALSLLFGDAGRERKLLDWMAERTVEEAVASNERTPAQAQRALDDKTERITKMAGLTSQGQRCFRAALHELIGDLPAAPRRSLALRILNWAFTAHGKRRKADACCDVCNPELVDQLRSRHLRAGPSKPRRAASAPTAKRGRRPRLRLFIGGLVALTALAGVITITTGSKNPPTERVSARATFAAYTAAFSDKGEFTTATSSSQGNILRACGRHTRSGRAASGRYTLCLLIDPSRPAEARVTGSYKTSHQRGRYACRGAARGGSRRDGGDRRQLADDQYRRYSDRHGYRQSSHRRSAAQWPELSAVGFVDAERVGEFRQFRPVRRAPGRRSVRAAAFHRRRTA